MANVSIEPCYHKEIDGSVKCIGAIAHTDDGRRYFRKEVVRKKHFFKLYKGYGIQHDVYLQIRNEIIGIMIYEKDTGKKLYASIDLWDANGITGEWGHGKQRILSEKYFTKVISNIKKNV